MSALLAERSVKVFFPHSRRFSKCARLNSPWRGWTDPTFYAIFHTVVWMTWPTILATLAEQLLCGQWSRGWVRNSPILSSRWRTNESSCQVYVDNQGLRFVFKVPDLKCPAFLRKIRETNYSAESGYTFVPGKDEVVRSGSKGYVITFGDALYRALDAVERLRAGATTLGSLTKSR